MGLSAVEAGDLGSPASPLDSVRAPGGNTCPRCGSVAAAGGHAEFGEWLDCYEHYLVRNHLTNWAAQYRSGPAADLASEPVR